MKKNNMIDLVSFCGGDTSKIEEWIKQEENREPKTIEELEKYPFKNNYSWVIRKEESAILHHLLMDRWYDGNRYETITLNDILERLEYGLEEYDYEQEEVDEIHKELIRMKFGSMVYDW